jgi:hypothetical protein
LNLPEIDETHAIIGKMVVDLEIENEDFCEITDISGPTYTISKVNFSNNSNCANKVKKGVIYDFTGNHYTLGSYTKLRIAYDNKVELHYQPASNQYSEVKVDFCFLHEKTNFQRFEILENANPMLEQCRIKDFIDFESILNAYNSTQKLVNSEFNLSGNLNDGKKVEVIDIIASNKKKKKIPSKNFFLKQLGSVAEEVQDENFLRNKRNLKRTAEIKKAKTRTKNLKESRKSSQSNTSDSDENTENKQTPILAKSKNKISKRELSDIVVPSTLKKPLAAMSSSSKPFQNKKIYLNGDKHEKFRKVIENMGGTLTKNFEYEECIVICDRKNSKFIRKLQGKGIVCYSNEFLVKGIWEENQKSFNLDR